MTLTAAQIKKFMRLERGEAIPSSQMKGEWMEEMMREGILMSISHKSRVSYRAKSLPALKQFIADRYQITDLGKALAIMESDEATRSEQVKISGDSKFKRQRTMKGFLVTSLQPIEASLNDHQLTICPPEGSFVYIYDYEHFRVADDVLIVGVENSENFRFIARQEYLFPKRKILFVSRYPVSGDFPKWLASVKNEYLHFGDFDLAGVHIFLSEIYKVVGTRTSFFVPDNIENLLQKGSSERYEKQLRYSNMQLPDDSLKHLVALIHKYRKGYDQEGLIM